MNIQEFTHTFGSHPRYIELYNYVQSTPQAKVCVQGLHGSEIAFFATHLVRAMPKEHMLFVLPNVDEASYAHSDLASVLGTKQLLFFPSSHKRSIQFNQADRSNRLLRTETLKKLSENAQNYIIVTYPEALIEKVISAETFETKKHILNVGERVNTEFINELLYEFGFERVDFVVEPGQFSVRGSIIDIFSYDNEVPYRIDFWDDEVESIRTFSIDDQRSIEKIDYCTIVPNIQNIHQNTTFIPLFTYIPNIYVLIRDIETSIALLHETYEQTCASYTGTELEHIQQVIISPEMFVQFLSQNICIEQNHRPYFSESHIITCNTIPQPSIHKNFELFGSQLVENQEKTYTNYFISQSITQVERIQDIFADINPNVELTPIITSLHKGFIDHDIRICCYTDHEIFERYHPHTVKKQIVSSDSFTIQDVMSLHPGDFVVHIDHGIGMFVGLERIEVNGKMQETVKLSYRDNDLLYVSIHNLRKISKYKGKDGIPPKTHKLGSGVWQTTKQKAKSKVKDIAKDLIALYAERLQTKGFRFSADTYLQQELEASFFFEDTPDQIIATKKVKEAMEAPHPMDMLVCGDVGFGKTEVAIRAAFKAVVDGKQVAVLVPTTILALQHYKTFVSRLQSFGCEVDYICRLRSAKQQKESIQRVTEGKTDILIGTHRLVSKDVHFKDLGLLIIDEEQKFGVSMKEKLKQLKIHVDTLTLTATPIPRTLQFSLMGARDLTNIKTPPPNRHPIVTELHTFQETIIRDAIMYEVERNGQVFIINNKIKTIYELESFIHKICPHVRTVVGHGQMEGKQLEQIMLDFINHEYDVLIATTIIESGLDIPNANTIIINDAHHFGLSDLHQLRGRVGRSNKKAFCYLLAPPKHILTREARQRLQAIEEFSELGSGFNIAMQDLDIRGAGNLLGAEQSGFITDIEFETYQKILNEALFELRETEYKEMYSNTHIPQQSTNKFVQDCVIETDMELLFPEYYIESTKERIKMYRELDTIETDADLQEFQEQLKDRFGNIPEETQELIRIVNLRWLAIERGVERIVLKNNSMRVYFISDSESPFYMSSQFTAILEFVQANPRMCNIKEKNNKLSIRFAQIKTVLNAIAILTAITKTNTE